MENILLNNGVKMPLLGFGTYLLSVVQIVLRWLIQREVVVIPKSANVIRMNENFDVFDFELSAADMATIKSLDKGSGLIYSI
jgi:diketogulonate reductase-like aldo/keto reductase